MDDLDLESFQFNRGYSREVLCGNCGGSLFVGNEVNNYQEARERIKSEPCKDCRALSESPNFQALKHILKIINHRIKSEIEEHQQSGYHD